MRFRERNIQKNSFIDITPIVDTVFNLLIFFALSLKFIVTPGISLDLPKSSVNEVKHTSEELTIQIDKEDKIFMMSNPIELENLKSLLNEFYSKNPETLIIIQADGQTHHEKVIDVIDSVKNAGFRKLAIGTEVKGKE